MIDAPGVELLRVVNCGVKTKPDELADANRKTKCGSTRRNRKCRLKPAGRVAVKKRPPAWISARKFELVLCRRPTGCFEASVRRRDGADILGFGVGFLFLDFQRLGRSTILQNAWSRSWIRTRQTPARRTAAEIDGGAKQRDGTLRMIPSTRRHTPFGV